MANTIKEIGISSLLIILAVIFSLGCTEKSPNTGPDFSGNGDELLIQLTDLSSGWELDSEMAKPDERPVEWRKTYYRAPDRFIGTITSYVLVVNREDVAIDYFDRYYQARRRDGAYMAQKAGLPAGDLMPPGEYQYTSPIADQFEVVYFPERSSVGYRYEAHARCGHITYGLTAVVLDPSSSATTQSKALYLLSWTELKSLLELMDKKVEKAC